MKDLSARVTDLRISIEVARSGIRLGRIQDALEVLDAAVAEDSRHVCEKIGDLCPLTTGIIPQARPIESSTIHVSRDDLLSLIRP
jgi:hypothetical protein